MSPDAVPLDPCGCCDPELPTPTLYNRPGKEALDYRIRTHGSALRAMVARLPRWTVPDGEGAGRRPLAPLTTRATDDPAIALLDAWAVATDVLTFYQERIANEGFLRTATERRSVLYLARAIGYELSPGVAAAGYLAFTVDESPGAPGHAEIPAGTTIQSVPAAAGERPQSYESSADFHAVAAWNQLRPRRHEPQPLALDSERVVLAGTGLGIEVGQLLLFLADEAGSAAADSAARRVLAVEPDPVANTTSLRLATPLPRAERGGWSRLDDRRGGRIEIAEGGKVAIELGETGGELLVGRALTLTEGKRRREEGLVPMDDASIQRRVLDRELTEGELQLLLGTQGWSADALLDYVNGRPAPATTGGITLHALRDRLSLFGHNAPLWASLPVNQRFGEWANVAEDQRVWVAGAYRKNWDDGEGRSIWTSSQGATYADFHVALERSLDKLEAGSWALLVGRIGRDEAFEAFRVVEVAERSLADYGLNGKVDALSLRYADGRRLARRITRRAPFRVRRTTAYVRSEALDPAPRPIVTPLAEGATSLTLDRMVVGLQPGQPVALLGEQADAPGVIHEEILHLKEIRHHAGLTTLEFTTALSHSYTRTSVTLNANVVHATHGETVTGEVLGSGDGSVAHQRFALARPPLTHLSAPTASGSASTLSVRVDGIEWTPVAALYGLAPDDRAYVVKIEDGGEATVHFGDGTQGARLPTGSENVVATYRSGIGQAGEVAAGALTLMKTRPFGARGVTNPLETSGAADPESLADARRNAPLRVLTLDRIVSLQDFEDFARAFAGIGKAQARALWLGEHALVHLTIAAADGDEIDPGSDLYRNLLDAIHAARDPLRELRLASYRPLYFELAARVIRDPAHEWAAVEAAIRATLLAAFDFARRAFAQPVSAAEVVTLIHTVPGVVAVDLDALYRVEESGKKASPRLAQVLAARPARPDPDGGFLPAELLRLNPLGITLTEMQA